jgi:hypothetical protein
MAKKSTPAQQAQAKKSALIQRGKTEFISIMQQNIGQKFTPQLATGINADFCRILDSLVADMEKVNGNSN